MVNREGMTGWEKRGFGVSEGEYSSVGLAPERDLN